MARFAVLYGSTRQARQGIKVARFVVKQLEERGHTVTLLDAMHIGLPFLDKMHKEFDGDAPKNMQDVHQVLVDADGFVFVSGEYNHSVPPALKNLLDHFQTEYFQKAAALATYSAGPFGGVRVGVHWRAILAELGMYSCSVEFAVSKVGDQLTVDGEDPDGVWTRRVQRLLDELEWLADALKAKRDKDGPPW